MCNQRHPEECLFHKLSETVLVNSSQELQYFSY